MDKKCPICLLPIETEKLNKLPCLHYICNECIKDFIQHSNQCPICKKEFINYESSTNEKINLTQEDLNLIEKEKKEFLNNEDFDCITIEEVEKQLKIIKKATDDISLNFSGIGNKGCDFEFKVISGIYEKIKETDHLLDLEEFNGKKIAKNLNDMILEIKRLKSRYYYSDSNDKFSEKETIIKINNNDDDNGFQCQFNIEYVDKKKKNNIKKKKRKK